MLWGGERAVGRRAWEKPREESVLCGEEPREESVLCGEEPREESVFV